MCEIKRMMQAELLKLRHSFLISLHLLVPIAGSLIFLLYYRISNWNEMAQISGFFEVMGIAYPFVISIVCAKAVELEEDNHFQTFLGVSVKKRYAFLSKWLVLLLLALGAVLTATFLFAAGNRFLPGNRVFGMSVYLKTAFLLWAGGLPLYLEHLYLNLRFSKSVSVGIGAAQFLLSALMLTGLGDGRWQFLPCTWAARGSQTFLLFSFQGKNVPLLLVELKNWRFFGILLTALLYVIIMIWFHYYEGRQCND